ncbi:MAG: hypothetical protein ACRDSN_14365, partial [Pseudonocardiaceae bacterium]
MDDSHASSRDQIRERVKHTLERDLAYLNVARHLGRDIPDGGASERVVGNLFAFRAAGLLSEEEDDAWRERFARAADAALAPDEEVATPQIRARAAEALESHLSGLASQSSKQFDAAESTRFHAMLAAITDVGALGEEEANDFTERRNSILGMSGGGRSQEAPPPPPPPKLLRVVVGPPERQSGVRVTAAELFTSFVRLWWHRAISPEEIAEREREDALDDEKALYAKWRRAGRKFKLSDDLGTVYEPQLAGSEEDTPWTWMTPRRIKPDDPEPLPL